MAIAYVGEIGTVTKDPAGTTSVITVGAAGVAAGNHIIIVGTLQGTNVVTSVTDTAGNTYTVDKTVVTAAIAPTQVCSAHVTNALVNGNTITINHASSVGAFLAEEFSGIATSSYVDQTAGTGATTSTAINTGATATLAATDDLQICAITKDGANSITLANTTTGLSNFTTERLTTGTTTRTIYGRYKIGVGTAAIDYVGTLSTARTHNEAVVAYKAAGATNVTLTPAAATAAGAAVTPVPNLAVSGQALAAGRAEVPAPSLAVAVAVALAAGSAPVATPVVSVTALASAAGSALPPEPSVTAFSVVAIASGRSDPPVPTISVSALASATGVAPPPSPSIAATAVVAVAVGAPPVPVPKISVTAVATATGTSPTPVVTIVNHTTVVVTAPAATAQAAAGSIADTPGDLLVPSDGTGTEWGTDWGTGWGVTDPLVPEDTLYPGDGVAGRTFTVTPGITVTVVPAVASGVAPAPAATSSRNVIVSPEPARAAAGALGVLGTGTGWGDDWSTDWGSGSPDQVTPGITVTGQAVAAGRAIAPTLRAITTDVVSAGTITPTSTLTLAVFIHLGGQVTPSGRLCKQWPFPVWTDITDGTLTLTGISDASLSLSSVTDASLSLSAVTDTSLTLTGIDDTTLTPTVVTEECS